MHTAAPKVTAQKHKKLEFQAAEINIEDKVYNQFNSKTGLRIFFQIAKLLDSGKILTRCVRIHVFLFYIAF